MNQEDKPPKQMTVEEIAQRVQRLEEEQQADAKALTEALEAARRGKTTAGSETMPPEPVPPPPAPAPEPKEKFIGYCRECGKSLTEISARNARGTMYCDEHVPAPEPAEASASAPTVTEHGIDRNRIAEIEKEIDSLKEKIGQKETELTKTTYLKKRKIKKEIEEVNKKIEEKEIEKDREEKLFLYYTAKKITDKNHSLCGQKPLDLRKTNLNYLSYKNLKETDKKNEGYFEFTISGFTMVIKNVKEIKGKDRINTHSDEAVYKIVGPGGETIEDNIKGFDAAWLVYDREVEKYEVEIKKEFNSKPLDQIRGELNADLSKEVTPAPEEKKKEKIFSVGHSGVILNIENEEEVKKEIENLPEEDKEKLGRGLSVIGYRVEKMKDDFFAKTLNLIVEDHQIKKGWKVKGVDKKGTLGRFVTELRNSFVRDSEEAQKKGMAIQKGKDKGKFRQVRNLGLLTGNVLKYGRIVADVTGASIANPFRYVMMGGMVTARAAEAGKEARFKSDQLLEKTQIEDAEKAAEEAWRIYKEAGGEIGNVVEENGVLKYEDGTTSKNTPSAEALKNAYLMEMPKDLQERLKDPTVALNFAQKIIRKQIEIRLNRLEKKIDWIGYKYDSDAISEKDGKPGAWTQKLSSKQIEIEKQKLLEKWKKELNDYDRMITQYGTADQLAMGARYAQIAGKGVVLAMQIETAVVGLDNLFKNLSHIFGSHDPIETTAKIVLPKTYHAPIGGKTFSPEESTRIAKLTGLQKHHNLITDYKETVENGQKISYETLKNGNVAKILPNGSYDEYTPNGKLIGSGIIDTDEAKVLGIKVTADMPEPPTATPTTPPVAEPTAPADASAPEPAAPKPEPSAPPHETPDSTAPKPAAPAPTQPTATPSPEAPTAPETLKNPINVKVDLSSKGYTQTIIELKKKLALQYANAPDKIPPGVKHFIETPSTKLAQDYGFWDIKAGTSGMGYQGETLSVDAEGHLRLGHLDGKTEIIDTTDHKFSGKMFTPEEQAPKVPNASSLENTPPTPVATEMDEPETFSKSRAIEEARRDVIKNMDDKTTEAPARENDGEWYDSPQKAHDAYIEKNTAQATHFLGISPKENFILNHNPLFLKNTFHLPPAKLMEACNTHQHNIAQIFQGDQIERWQRWKDVSANKFLEKNPTQGDSLVDYINKLKKTTGLKPKGGLFFRHETVNEYIARALQKAASIPGGLQRIAESIRK